MDLRALSAKILSKRGHFPDWVNRSLDFVVDHPPKFLWKRLSPFAVEVLPGDVPPPPVVPLEAKERIIIGPVNYSGQGTLWARAIEKARPGSWVHCFAISVPGGFAFPTDTEVPMHVHATSSEWQDAQLTALTQTTHVLVEAERPLLGRRFKTFEIEARELRSSGVHVAFLAHGTDVRLPSLNKSETPWSVYHDSDVYGLRDETLAQRNIDALRRLGGPIFVSTPDLLSYLPEAHWCPVVVDVKRWQATSIAGERQKPVVVHAPSVSKAKGTDLVEPALRDMHSAGLIEYRQIRGIPAEKMPDVYGDADIMLDQFRVGSYGVAACESMSSGRVVLGHVTEKVRETVRQATGMELPIVEATPDTLTEVIQRLVNDRAAMREIGESGKRFARTVHDGTLSAKVLSDNWLDAPSAGNA